MAETVGLTSAIVSLVTTAYTSCQKLYSTFDGARNAPKHIATISNDLEDFYLVLGTFQSAFGRRRVLRRYSATCSVRQSLQRAQGLPAGLQGVQHHHLRVSSSQQELGNWDLATFEVDVQRVRGQEPSKRLDGMQGYLERSDFCGQSVSMSQPERRQLID